MHRIQENISRQFSFSNSVFNENDDKLFENLYGKIEKRDLMEFFGKKEYVCTNTFKQSLYRDFSFKPLSCFIYYA